MVIEYQLFNEICLLGFPVLIELLAIHVFAICHLACTRACMHLYKNSWFKYFFPKIHKSAVHQGPTVYRWLIWLYKYVVNFVKYWANQPTIVR